jgi:hypothetical protein
VSGPDADAPGTPGAPALTLDDIWDLRAYERVRQEFRAEVMAKKRLRRLPLGPIMTLVFECRDTVKFQIQEMARVEKIATDEGIQAELDVYNRLLPAPGVLSATLFIELTSEDQLRHWLPRLVGIERSIGFAFGDDGPPAGAVPDVTSVPEADHAGSLTREAVTPSVHYLRFSFDPGAVARFATDPLRLVAFHPAYQAATPVPDATRSELLADLRGDGSS